MDKIKFIKGVEKLVNPIEVGSLHFIQYFNNFIPKKIQESMVNSSGKKTPYMGFVVEPYSYFICYEIIDLELAKTHLPKGFRLIKTKIFEDSEPNYYVIFGCINAHTSGFWGSRIEFYIIAEDTSTGLLSWIIVDYDTNTITHDPKYGLRDPNVEGSVITTDYSGELFVDMVNEEGRKLVFNSNIKQGIMKTLDNRLWVEGNLSITYGKNKSQDKPKIFSLIFDPKEFNKALKISNKDLTICENNWFSNMYKKEPTEIVCFPYSQHFLSDSPGHYSNLKSESDLNKILGKVDFDKIDVFSTKAIKKMFLIGGLISMAINIMLLFLLFLR